MASFRALRLTRRAHALIALVAFAPFTTGCGLFGDDEPLTEVTESSSANHGACIPTYGSRVVAADMNSSASRIGYLSSSKPGTLPEEQSWGSDDRALVIMDIDADGAATSRHIATTWAARDSILAYATEAPGRSSRNVDLPETMLDIQMDDAGSSFALGVQRRGGVGVYSGIYRGAVPETGTAQLDPENGLSAVEIVSPSGIEGITMFWLSPDGNKVAAVVGNQNELRVYDAAAESGNLHVYELDEEGEIEVVHEMPAADTNLDTGRRPALTSRGLMRAVWSPGSDKLALVRTEGLTAVGQSSLLVLDVASGALENVTSYAGGAAPHPAWSADGASLWVMNTPLGSGTDSEFGNAQIHHIEAAEGGDEIGSGASLPRQLGWRTDPGNLVNFKDGESLVYTWESRIYRLDVPDGSLSGAESAYLLLRQNVPEDLQVLPETPVTSADNDAVMFLIQDSGGTGIALRRAASEESCPFDVLPEGEGDAATEGEATEGEATEGEAESGEDGG